MTLRWMNYLLIILFAWFLAGLIWKLWLLQKPVPGLVSLQLGPVTTDASEKRFDSQQIRAAALFGQVVKTEQKQPEKPTEKVVDTRLNIKLLGVLSGEFNAAIISYQGRQGSFRVADYLDGKSRAIRLLEIHSSHVIISNRGKRERLALPKRRTNAVALGLAKQEPPEERQLSANLNSPQISQLLGGDIRGTITNNPLSLAKFLRLSPVDSNQGQRGYRINYGKDQRLLNQVGFRHGDLVTKINSQPVTNLSFKEAFDMLEGQDSLTLEFLRQGRTYTMDLQL